LLHNWPLVAFTFYGVVMAALAPRIFYHAADLPSLRGIKLRGLYDTVQLAPSMQNITTSIYLIGTMVAAMVAFQVPTTLWQRFAPWLFGFGVLLLVLLLVPGVSREVNGARRWLPLVVINLQPSELVKLFAVVYAADYTVRKDRLASPNMTAIGASGLDLYARDEQGKWRWVGVAIKLRWFQTQSAL
jgi:hypothetical protein